MELFNKIHSLPSEQKKRAVQRKLNELLAGKIVRSVSLDPYPTTFAAFLHVVCSDDTTLTVAHESVTCLDLSDDDGFVIRVNGEVVATL